MAKCDVCCLAKDVLMEVDSECEKSAIRIDWEEHLNRQRKARDSYYARRDEGIGNADVTSLILDGMDQSKTDLPRFVNAPNCLDAANTLKTHLTGALIHGKPTRIFLDLHQYPHDSNLTINCLFRCLFDNCNGRLTKTLYIQLDNCGRENKNRFLLAALALLIIKNKTKAIYVNFLMVGHTHEDIDQKFSVISRKLKQKQAKTLPELKDIIDECGMEAHDVLFMYDVKAWLLPFLSDGLHNHSNCHSFRLRKNSAGSTVLEYKKWPMDDEWSPKPDEEPVQLFRLENNAVVLPTGVPPAVLVSWEKNCLQKVKATINKVDLFFNEEQKEWWKSFLDHPPDGTRQDWEWPVDIWEDVCEQGSAMTTVTPNRVTPLTHSLQKERQLKQVYSGKRSALKNGVIRNVERTVPVKELDAVGHMVVFRDSDTTRFGKVSSVTETSLKVNLYRRDGDKLFEAETRLGQLVQKIINRDCVVENLAFCLPSSKRIPNRIILALANLETV